MSLSASDISTSREDTVALQREERRDGVAQSGHQQAVQPRLLTPTLAHSEVRHHFNSPIIIFQESAHWESYY